MAVLEPRRGIELVRLRHARAEGHVWTGAVVVRGPLANNRAEMSLAERDDSVETLAPQGSDQTFAIGVGTWSPDRRTNGLDAEGADGGIHHSREDGVVVVDQVLVRVVARDGVAKLLCGPFGSRMSGDVDVEDPSRADLHDEMNVENAAEERALDGEVHRQQGVGMIAD